MRYPEAESNLIELKRETPKNDQIVKTMIGFCNTHGGKLVLGVADNREIIGLSDSEIENLMESIDKSIADSCSPHVLPRVYAQRFGEQSVLIIEVSEGMNKPYFKRSEGFQKGVFVRLGRHTLRASPEMIDELTWKSKGFDYESLPVFQADWEKYLDLSAIETFLKNRKNARDFVLDELTLRSYRILVQDQARSYPTVLGLLLFGKNPQEFFSEAMIICSHFSGIDGREVIATVDCEGTLFNQFKQASAFISSRLYRSFTIQGLQRTEKLEIPEIAIREVLLNMIIHRSYALKAPAKIAIYDDRLEFFSPGSFPGPLSVENLKSGITYLRNPGICKIMREVGYIEKMGTGFITVFDAYEKNGLDVPKIFNGENFVKCILPRPSNQRLATQEKLKSEIGVSEFDQMLDLLGRSPEVSISDVMPVLSISKSTALRKLSGWVEKGLLERIGQTRNTRYRKK